MCECEAVSVLSGCGTSTSTEESGLVCLFVGRESGAGESRSTAVVRVTVHRGAASSFPPLVTCLLFVRLGHADVMQNYPVIVVITLQYYYYYYVTGNLLRYAFGRQVVPVLICDSVFVFCI